ncbi:MAG: hypothetical protein EOP66_01320 [Sphingomonas sp.]|nr:MAG: hypothetical protein EOP66_01320 [Sphingomonas sp.]
MTEDSNGCYHDRHSLEDGRGLTHCPSLQLSDNRLSRHVHYSEMSFGLNQVIAEGLLFKLYARIEGQRRMERPCSMDLRELVMLAIERDCLSRNEAPPYFDVAISAAAKVTLAP